MSSHRDTVDDNPPIFGGSDSEDVTLFIHAVKKYALAKGQERDDEWLSHFVESCLIGDAMVWFNELDEDVTETWRTLSRAFLKRFKHTINAALPPTPASAGPPSGSGPAGPTRRVPPPETLPILPSQVASVPNTTPFKVSDGSTLFYSSATGTPIDEIYGTL